MSCRVGGKGFIHLAQQVVRDKHGRTSLESSFIEQELANVD